ncbi:hypothetical protein HDE_00358 [Halotydeus destructor]|nr:hypothetical protein HDE_00358 [Halotydeus destructor]
MFGDEDEDDDFDDFQTATVVVNNQSEPETNSNLVENSQLGERDTIDTLIQKAFSLTPSADLESSASRLSGHLLALGSVKLWQSICNGEFAVKSKFTWRTSRAFELFLESMKLNLHSIPDVPRFAFGLGLLEPTKPEQVLEPHSVPFDSPDTSAQSSNVGSLSDRITSNVTQSSSEERTVKQSLSIEAQLILDELPIISFMSAIHLTLSPSV